MFTDLVLLRRLGDRRAVRLPENGDYLLVGESALAHRLLARIGAIFPETIGPKKRLRSARIRTIHQASRESYGAPRVHAELLAQKVPCCRNTVAKLMRRAEILPKAIRRFRVTTDSRRTQASPNLIHRDFRSKHPNDLWLSDITYIPTREGWLYLAAVLDAYSRALVGWSMSRNLDTRLAMNALNMAIAHRGPPVTLHSDQGSTYATGSYREIVNRYGIRQSMSRKGDCWDNAPMESFFHTLKTEWVMHCDYKTRDDARASLFDYIEVFYNRQRRHSSINYEAPLPYEATCSPGKVSTVRG
ncbi:MAG: IS3 family transposase [Burkholderiales bacterium]